MTTIQQQQTLSAALTGATWITSAFALLSVLASNGSNAILGAIATVALLFINHNQTATTTTETTTPAATVTASSDKFDPGFTVTPTDLSIKSGASITLNVVTGVATTILTIDWLDGVIESIPLTVTSAGKVASPTHTYTYVQGGSQYTGHTFYPKFIVSNGSQSKIFNDVANGQGAACAILVSI